MSSYYNFPEVAMVGKVESKEKSSDTKRQVAQSSLEQQLAQRNAELAIINSIQAALAAKLDIQAIYDLVGDKIREIFDQADVNIRIYDAGTNMVHYPYYYQGGERLVIESTPLDDHGFEFHIIRTRESLVINEHMEQAVQQYGSYLMPGEVIEKSSVFVPLVVGDRAHGLINLKDMEHEHAYGESDVSLLSTLANSLSVALENARLFDETRRYSQEITSIAEIGREISATLDLSIVLERIASRAKELLHARDVVLRLLEADGLLRAVVAIGKYADVYKDWHARLGHGLSGTVAKTGIAEIINDPENDPRVLTSRHRRG
jgi:transcriptional regulator with GAF, ATPase, and Fis domain